MPRRLRLSSTAAVTVTGRGAALRSDLGVLELTGADVGAFVARMLPLLDGSRSAAELAAELPEYSAESVAALLATLEQRGVLEPAEGDRCFAPQDAWLARFTDAGAARRRLESARVLVVGLEPWGAEAAAELAAAGVGRLHALDGEELRAGDLELARVWAAGDAGRPRGEALVEALGSRSPWCEVSAGAPGDLAGLPPGGWDLVVAALPGDALHELKALARAAHAAETVSIYGQLDGTDAVVGPVVIPGATACWNCTRLRLLAHSLEPAAAHEVQAALLAGRGPRRERTYLAPAAGLLGHALALEAVKLLSGYTPSQLAGRQLVQSLVTLETTLHAVVRMPWCDVCGGAAAGGPSDPPAPLDQAASPAELRERLAGWADERTGVIQQLVVDMTDARQPELPVTATAVLARYTEGHPDPHEHELASGKGLSAAEALLGAAGEAVERYSAARVPLDGLVRASLDELDGDALDPRLLCLYAEEQYAREGFPFAPFDPERPIEWTRGRWLDSGEPVWLPALPTYYNFPAPRGERFCQVTSSGLAAGRDEDDAARRAILELVERDAFTLSWLARLPGRRLAGDGLGAEIGEVARQLGECGAELELWLLDSEIPIPVVACLGLGDGERWPGLTVSLAAHPSAEVAARKAILEHGHVGPYIRRLVTSGDHAIPATPEEVGSLVEHALYYAPAERRQAVDFLRARDRPPLALDELGAVDDSLEGCATALAAGGVRVAIADVTAPDVRTGPFRVARALGVHVQQIHFGHGLERLANPRLQARLSNGPNPDPHPLA